MSAHDTHNPDIENSGELKSRTSFQASFWFVIILVGLFIAALNFVKVMNNDHEEGHGGGHGTEHATEHATPGQSGHEGSATPDAHGNTATGPENASHDVSGHETEEANSAAGASPATDSAAAGAHH